jgi:S-adenosylmethionine:tRNA ribosyltransferase-isomerase
MKNSDLQFHRSEELATTRGKVRATSRDTARATTRAATRPAEMQGRLRDSGRLLVSSAGNHLHASFIDLADHLLPGDLLVVNRSATLPASLPAAGKFGPFTLNLSTNYGAGLWLAEPRMGPAEPGPIPGISAGDSFGIVGTEGRLIAPFPGLPRLWFVQFDGDVCGMLRQAGRPIRYGYLDKDFDLDYYQTIFAAVPGSVEMPSAAYPFTRRVLKRLKARGVRLAGLLLHTGVSSQELDGEEVENHTLYPEPYKVPAGTARAVNMARAQGRRVIAVGTTVVRALESAWDGQEVRPSAGFTSLYIHPKQTVNVVVGLLTGLHDPVTSHMAMLYALAGKKLIREAYAEAVQEGYHWHEFGDSHLIFPSEPYVPPALPEFQRPAVFTGGNWATTI